MTELLESNYGMIMIDSDAEEVIYSIYFII